MPWWGDRKGELNVHREEPRYCAYTGKWGKHQRQCVTDSKPVKSSRSTIAEQGGLAEGKKALLELSKSKLYRELEKAA